MREPNFEEQPNNSEQIDGENIPHEDEQSVDIIPPQYRDLPSEVAEELWVNPVYIDPEKNRSETARREVALEAIKENENKRETEKNQQLNRKYTGLLAEQKAEFPNAQKDAGEILGEHINNKTTIDSLLPEESFVLDKLRTAYTEFKQKNPDQPFRFELGNKIDHQVYSNLVRKMAFKVLESNRNVKEQEEANDIRKEIGIPEQPVDKSEYGLAQEEETDPGKIVAKEIKAAFEVLGGGIGGELLAKTQEYVDRIRAVEAGNPLKSNDTLADLKFSFKSFTGQEWSDDFDIDEFEKAKYRKKIEQAKLDIDEAFKEGPLKEDDFKSEDEKEKNDNLFKEFRFKNGTTVEITLENGETGAMWWNVYTNAEAKRLKEAKEFEWGKERIYFDVPLASMKELGKLSMEIAGEQHIPIGFKYLDVEKTYDGLIDGKETRFVTNFASAKDARRFYEALSKNQEYRLIQSDRDMDYNGYNIDGVAHYASGFRENRSAVEKIIKAAKQNTDGTYSYKGNTIDKINYDKWLDEYQAYNPQKKWESAI